MTIQEASPPLILWRIGWYLDPLGFPPWEYTGAERFDDPLRGHRVLYTAESRLACFLETLAHFRPDIAWLAEVQATPPDATEPDFLDEAGIVPADWHVKRRIGWIEPRPFLRALDLRSLETHVALRRELATLLHERGYEEFDFSIALNNDRQLSQHIARFARQMGFHAIVYASRLDPAQSCWAIFEPATRDATQTFVPLGTAPIERSDADLINAARMLGLRL